MLINLTKGEFGHQLGTYDPCLCSVGGIGVDALTKKLAGADEHEAVNQHGFALGSGREVATNQGAFTGIVEVPGDIDRGSRCNGDQCIERRTPGIQWVR